MNNKRISYHSGNPRVLGALDQEPGTKTKCIFYYATPTYLISFLLDTIKSLKSL